MGQISLPLPPGGFYSQSIAYADEGSGSESASDEFASSESDVTYDTGEYNNKHSQSEDALSNLLNQFLMISTGYTATLATVGCGQTLAKSFWAYIAGSVIYLSGEIQNMKHQEESSKEVTSSYTSNDNQSEAFFSAAETQQKGADAAAKRARMQNAASVAFALAGGLALWEFYKVISAQTKCLAGAASILSASLGTHAGCAAAITLSPALRTSVFAPSSALACQATDLKSEQLAPLCAPCAEHALFEKVNKSCCPGGVGVLTMREVGLGVGAAALGASDGDLLSALKIGGGPLLAYFQGVQSVIGAKTLAVLGDPLTRGILFLGFGTLARSVAIQSEQAESAYRNQAEDLRRQGEELQALIQGSELASNSASDFIYGEGSGCYGQSSGGSGVGYDSNCSCQGNNNCARFDLEDTSFRASVGGESLAGVVKTLEESANLFSQGKSKQGFEKASELAGQKDKVDRFTRSIQSKINSELKNNKQPSLGFAQREKELLSQIDKEARKKLSDKDKKALSSSLLAKSAPRKKKSRKASQRADQSKGLNWGSLFESSREESSSIQELDLDQVQKDIDRIPEAKLNQQGLLAPHESLWERLEKSYLKAIPRLYERDSRRKKK